jgi:RNA polymerase sigma-70 factor (ECF subfamily)
MPLIILGNDAFNKVMDFEDWSAYHYEAAIAREHVQAIRYENTNWKKLLELYELLYQHFPTDPTLLSLANVHLQLGQLKEAKQVLDSISDHRLQQRLYLLHGSYAEYYHQAGHLDEAIGHINKAIQLCTNEMEKKYLGAKKSRWESTL